MGRALALAAIGAVLCVNSPGRAAGDELVVTDRRAVSGESVAVLDLGQGVVDVQKGAGTDVGAIALTLDLERDGARAHLAAPAGAFDGVAGWLNNTTSRARYRDDGITTGGAAVGRVTIKTGRRLRVKAWGVGSALLDTLGASAGPPVRAAVSIVNGADTVRSCVAFASSDCAFRVYARRTVLTCRRAAADAGCGAVPTTTTTSTSVPTTTTSTSSTLATTSTVTTTTSTSTTSMPAVCGNLVRESGEQCDGIPECSPTCTLPALAAVSCCLGEASCQDTPAFSLAYYVYSFCNFSDHILGGVCDYEAGTCTVPVFPEPISACCEYPRGGCSNGAAPLEDNNDLWWYRNTCTGAGGGMVYDGTCDSPSGRCVRN